MNVRLVGGDTLGLRDRAGAFLSDPALPGDRTARVAAALRDIDATGTYALTAEERVHGCRVAWREYPGCIGRGSWRSLAVVDLSTAALTPETVARACADYLRHATNGGRLQPMIMLFPSDPPGRPPRLRFWNDQLVRYAGEARPDGTVWGDPKHVRLTAALRDLGWADEVGRQTPLPLTFQIDGGAPRWVRLPPEDIMEVPLTHPRHPWFAELGLVWHALPAISRMLVVIGGITFPAVFSGWYVATEILENLARYGTLPVIAERLGLDLGDPLWEDFTQPEVLRAILHSYRAAGVTIEDHHRADERHHRYETRAHRAGRVVRGDKGRLVLAACTATMHARTADHLPPDPHADPTFRYPPDPLPVPETLPIPEPATEPIPSQRTGPVTRRPDEPAAEPIAGA